MKGRTISRSEEYKELLKSPKWKRKRTKILVRDGRKCIGCGCTTNLEVHHIWYIIGNLPWQVPNKYLRTLCRTCHQAEHDKKPIQKFFRQGCKSRKKLSKKTAKPKKKSKIPELKGRDKVLQKRYDKLRSEGKII